MSEKHPIDELFRKSLEERQPAFDESYWQEAEQLLKQPAGPYVKLATWKLFTMAAACMAISGMAGYYFGSNNKLNEKESAVLVDEQIETVSTETMDHTLKKRDSAYTAGTMEQDQPGKQDTSQAGISSIHESAAFVPVDKSGYAFDSSRNMKTATASRQSTEELTVLPSYMQHAQRQDQKSSLPAEKPVAGEQLLFENESRNQDVSVQHHTIAAGSQSTENFDRGKNAVNEQNVSAKDDDPLASSTGISKDATIISEYSQSSIPKLSVHDDDDAEFTYAPASKVPVTPANLPAFIRKNHSTKVRSFEFSATAGAAMIKSSSAKTNETGFEWHVMPLYRMNNWILAAGAGQFTVKEEFTASVDSFIDHSYLQQIITMDSIWVVDTSIVIIDSFPVMVIDSFFQSFYDTTYQQVTLTDTITTDYQTSSSGHYTEIPLLFGYRFPVGHFKIQLTSGLAYGWYSGTIRYRIDSEGKLYSYKPGSVVSLLGRVTLQYPVTHRFLLQGYVGARYSIGLKKDIAGDNYLQFATGLGLLYKF